MDGELHEVGGVTGLRTRHAEVRREGETESAADGRTLHGAHERDTDLEEPGGPRVEILAVARAPVAEVGAGAEGPSLRAEHRGTDVDVGGERLECVRDGADLSDGQEVVRRVAHLDDADMSSDLG